ncbi:MAG TPA: AMP-binding protein [Verrucomicrobiae bacterium]|jgi:acetyl-CoA synthetase|nr:AMP-binding protein [Verrucomicrobiae bacterium]
MKSSNEEMPESPPPAWTPTPEFINTTNVAWLMRRAKVDSYEALHKWSVQNREEFWKLVIERLEIRFQKPFSRVMDLSDGVENPRWLVDARFNIVESCFAAPADSPAIIHQAEGGALETMTVGELKKLTDRVASSLKRCGFKPGDALAIIMPMTVEAVAIYLGIIKAGCVVVGIADSFQPKEISTRLRLARAVAVFTQDVLLRGGKSFPLYANVVEADAPPTIVLSAKNNLSLPLRAGDFSWAEFLGIGGSSETVIREPADSINILFSSGTTGEPKAIPWTQTTPIKCAMDAHFHQNIQPGDVLVWPTNLGWMMGSWLVFASLLNKATLGLYYGTPTGREFGTFVQKAKTTMLGVIPSLVKTWRNTGCMENLNWSAVKIFTSTGECSSAEDMRWLMSRADGKPVIEYCGGTEIGGGYITGTVTRPCQPGAFNTPALGLDFVILDEAGNPTEAGELFIVTPSIGLSTALLNQEHHEIYFAGTPKNSNDRVLRRHGDQMEKLPGGFWRGLGRADDTMNIGGIKVSSAEIEQTLQSVPIVKEVAAIAVSSDGGPSQLVVYAVCSDNQTLNGNSLIASMQNAIKRELNPLFKIHKLILVDVLPRTASNKIMRRALRDQFAIETTSATNQDR